MKTHDQSNPPRDLREQLADLLRGRVRILGLGNIDFGDDGFGIHLAQQLLEAGVPDVIVAGTAPENYIGRAGDEDIDRLVFLDAVDFGAAPGSVAIMNAKQISARYPQISTHKISLSVLARWVQANGRTEVWLVGAQPQSLQAGQGLTLTLEATLTILRDFLIMARALPGSAGPNIRGRQSLRESHKVCAHEEKAITAC